MMRRGSEAAGEPPGFKYECISTVLALLFAIGIIAASIVAGVSQIPCALIPALDLTVRRYSGNSNNSVVCVIPLRACLIRSPMCPQPNKRGAPTQMTPTELCIRTPP